MPTLDEIKQARATVIQEFQDRMAKLEALEKEAYAELEERERQRERLQSLSALAAPTPPAPVDSVTPIRPVRLQLDSPGVPRLDLVVASMRGARDVVNVLLENLLAPNDAIQITLDARPFAVSAGLGQAQQDRAVATRDPRVPANVLREQLEASVARGDYAKEAPAEASPERRLRNRAINLEEPSEVLKMPSPRTPPVYEGGAGQAMPVANSVAETPAYADTEREL